MTGRSGSIGEPALRFGGGEFGWMSVIRDPTGAHLALWKASPKK